MHFPSSLCVSPPSSSFERGDWILIPLRETGWEEGMEEGGFLGNQSVLYGGFGVAHTTESLTIDFQCRAEFKVCSGLFSVLIPSCISPKTEYFTEMCEVFLKKWSKLTKQTFFLCLFVHFFWRIASFTSFSLSFLPFFPGGFKKGKIYEKGEERGERERERER